MFARGYIVRTQTKQNETRWWQNCENREWCLENYCCLRAPAFCIKTRTLNFFPSPNLKNSILALLLYPFHYVWRIAFFFVVCILFYKNKIISSLYFQSCVYLYICVYFLTLDIRISFLFCRKSLEHNCRFRYVYSLKMWYFKLCKNIREWV